MFPLWAAQNAGASDAVQSALLEAWPDVPCPSAEAARRLTDAFKRNVGDEALLGTLASAPEVLAALAIALNSDGPNPTLALTPTIDLSP